MQFIDLKTQQAAIKPELDRRIAAVLAHGQYIMGPEVAELETALAAFVGARHCISVASGTEAILIALMALGIGPGDEVITTPFTFVATAEMIVLLGAKPVFVDIDARTANIDPDLIERAITARTKAIMPVSLYGQCADMDRINAIAARHGNIPVIEDAAQSFGASYHGRRSCGLSTFGATSFFPSKPLGCYGDGGALFTNDDALATAAREIRVHGQSRRYVHTRIGVGGRMDTLQCAIVLAKWPRFPAEIADRAHIGARYTELLRQEIPDCRDVANSDVGKNLASVLTLVLEPGRTSVHAQFTVLVPSRDKLQARLQASGIPTAVHYPVPLNHQPAYRDPGSAADAPSRITAVADCPTADWMSAHVMSLPMGPDLSEADMTRVVRELANALSTLDPAS